MTATKAPPLVTFVLLSYNQQQYIAEAVDGALNQVYERLQIILSDDCSTDSTFALMSGKASTYAGRHEVSLLRNSENLGLVRHFNKVMGMARGDIIVVAAGDDVSLPLRVSATVGWLGRFPKASFVSFRDTAIDGAGFVLPGLSKEPMDEPRHVKLSCYIRGACPHLSGASRGFRRSLFDVFGDIGELCPTEDTPYLLRGLMVGDGIMAPGPGILYRWHGDNLSGPRTAGALSIERIKEQYLVDAARARDRGLIDDEELLAIKGWAEKDYRRRLLFRELSTIDCDARLLFCKAMWSRDLSAREKLGYLLRARPRRRTL